MHDLIETNALCDVRNSHIHNHNPTPIIHKFIFSEFHLLVNVDKTERTVIGHSDMGVNQSAWRTTRKLGSLLGVEEDVIKRIQLATHCFNGLSALWKHREQVAQHIRVQLYRAIVESVLLYNCGTWALPVALADRLDRAQRKMLRRVVGLKWSDKVTNMHSVKSSLQVYKLSMPAGDCLATHCA